MLETARRSPWFNRIFVGLIGILFVSVLYGAYYYFLRNDFQEIGSDSKGLNFFVTVQEPDRRAIAGFWVRLNTKTGQMALVFLHPEARLAADRLPFAQLTMSGDGSEVIDALEDALGEKVHYRLAVTTTTLARFVDLFEGQRLFLPRGLKNNLGDAPFPSGRFVELPGEVFVDYIRYLDEDSNLGRLRRLYRQQSIVLDFLNRKNRHKKVLRSDKIVQIFIDSTDFSPSMTLAEALSLRDYFLNTEIVPTLWRFPLGVEKVDDGEALVLLAKRVALTNQIFKKVDKPGGILEDKTFKARVYNAVKDDSDGLAKRVSYRLKTQGVFTLRPENYPGGYLDETVILDYSGHPSFAKDLAKKLKLNPAKVAEAIDPNKGLDLDAVVILGDDFPRKRKKKKK